MRLYTMFDSKAETFGRPVCAPTDAAAMRSVQKLLVDTNSPYHQNPEDFSLFRTGDFDDQTGITKTCGAPILVATCMQLWQELAAREDRQMSLLEREDLPVVDLETEVEYDGKPHYQIKENVNVAS